MIDLPATLADFTAYQEHLLRRHLTAAEREATAEWLDIFNSVRSGEVDGAAVVEDIDYLMDSTDDAFLLRFLEAARKWAVYAWKGVR